MWTYVVCVTLLLSTATAKREYGSCDPLTPEWEFSIPRFSLTWYLQYSLDSVSADCISIYFVNGINEMYFTIEYKDLMTNKTTKGKGVAKLLNPAKVEAAFEVTYKDESLWKWPHIITITFVDNHRYSVIEACSPQPLGFRNRHLWVLTRSPNYTTPFPTLDVKNLFHINHKGCNYK
uniref:Lipocalin/cytosolic fatty-acid binding domain-containing protein n=1 Tax=Clastoptera arizonana TaxID=38151 RepID=A0A1B6DAK7_9HEMI